MATKKGIWNLQQVRDKYLQSLWSYFDLSVGNGELYTWGSNERGTLALNDRTYRSSPTQVGSGTDWSRLIRAGYSNNGAGAIKSDGTLWVWGRNDKGQLGQNQSGNTDYSSPVQIPGSWTYGAASIDSMLVVNTSGELWSWGGSGGGVLGQNSNVSYSSPVQIPGTDWVDVSGGYEVAAAVKTSGQLWMWGNNYKGNLGQNNKTNYSSPRQVPGTTWTLSNNTNAGGNAQRFVKTDGSLWSWGYNAQGGLGHNNLTDYSSPVQVGSSTDWSTIGGDSYNGIGVKTDGTMWVWGKNEKGQLGQNQPQNSYYSSPVQIPGTTWVVGVFPNRKYAFATKTDGTLWSWGYGAFGFLGVNDRTQYSSPVQVPGIWSTKVNGIGGAVYNGYGIKPIDS